jgi:Zn-dependent M28 family amino/carboxypeptidase
MKMELVSRAVQARAVENAVPLNRTGRGASLRPSPDLARCIDLEQSVRLLATEIGERNLRNGATFAALCAARDLIRATFENLGLEVREQVYDIEDRRVANIEVEFAGNADSPRVIVFGAHYDSAWGSPGANDNGTGIAVLLQLARVFATGERPRNTLRLVAFTAEEPPFTRTKHMGSRVYAKRARARRDKIEAMISLECLGSFYSGHRGKNAPFPLRYASPWRGDFLAIVSDLRSCAIGRVVQSAASLTAIGQVRVRRVVGPRWLPGVRSSDHWSFWKAGYRAAMLTDTAPLRSRHYHQPTDRPDHLDFVRLSRVALLVEHAAAMLLGHEP